MGVFLVFASSCEKKNDDNNTIPANVFTDSRDGKVYKMVTIGDQVWMAENLAYAPSSGNYWAYGVVETYGYVYDWYTAQNVCPTGWHLPSAEELTILHDNVGGVDVGVKMKSTYGWNENRNGTNESGFSGLPGGYYVNDEIFFRRVGFQGCWWSSTMIDTTNIWNDTSLAWFRTLEHNSFNKFLQRKERGNSVRCLKD